MTPYADLSEANEACHAHRFEIEKCLGKFESRSDTGPIGGLVGNRPTALNRS